MEDEMQMASCEVNPVELSLRQELTQKRQQAEQRVADIKRAQELLNKHPELGELLTIINRLKRY